MTETGVTVGTPLYMALEQAMGKAEIRSDIDALGVIAYHLLAGQPPFMAAMPMLLIKHIQQAPPLRSFNNSVSPGLQAVVEKALAKQPSARFGSAGDFAIAFSARLNG